MNSINPATGELSQQYSFYTDREIQQTIDSLDKIYLKWSEKPIIDRSQVLHSIAQALKNEKESHAKIISTEMGKPIKEARKEVEKCALACEYFAEKGIKFLESHEIESGRFVSYEPLGIIFGIMPWNFPYWQVFRFAAATLMAGNVVLIKHAPNVSGCALAIEKLFQDVGYPILRIIIADIEKVEPIIADPRIQAVTVTGSVKAGQAVAALAGKYVKKSLLELGGSDPFIILEDANLEKCVPMAVLGRLINNGQSCIASKRFIVAESLHDLFCEKLLEAVKQMKIGNPFDEDTDLGPLAREDLLLNLDQQVQRSLSNGAKNLYGGKRLNQPGFYYPPTILTQVNENTAVYKEETFGPIFPIIKVKNLNEAIKVANDSIYGLGASLWTRNKEKINHIIPKIKTGNIFINSVTESNVKLPFGGIKQSGYGRELSYHGIREFVNIKTISWV